MVLIGIGHSGVDRIQPRRLLLAVAAGTVTAVPGTGSIDSRYMQDPANGQRSKASWRRRAALSLGISIFLLVVGAILTFAVDVTTSGFNLNTVGVILMVAGALGLVLSLLFWSSFSPYRRSRTVAGPDTVVEERRIERELP
jgi:hypothetical protein